MDRYSCCAYGFYYISIYGAALVYIWGAIEPDTVTFHVVARDDHESIIAIGIYRPVFPESSSGTSVGVICARAFNTKSMPGLAKTGMLRSSARKQSLAQRLTVVGSSPTASPAYAGANFSRNSETVVHNGIGKMPMLSKRMITRIL